LDNSEQTDPPNSVNETGGFSPMVFCHSGRC
jgi:hypothetical protein